MLMPYWLPSPSSCAKRGVSCGVLMSNMSRMPASISVQLSVGGGDHLNVAKTLQAPHNGRTDHAPVASHINSLLHPSHQHIDRTIDAITLVCHTADASQA